MTIRRSLSAAFLLVLVSATHAAATTWLVPGNGSNTCTTGSPNCNTIGQAVTRVVGGRHHLDHGGQHVP